ncbi:MAG: methionyl-tRNA formyltransferase [Lachnospiraceae bacterium]|nr:methionyl-tRNA formyltransferase [Lachnospiraceae bacterium]
MRVLYMGTPDFAVGTLEALIQSEHEVIGVVTQPDRPKGRSGKMQFSPVKETALKYDIPVYQPERARDGEFLREVRSMGPDVIVVAAFGQILPKELLEMPKYGCINVHASLLPKLRGAAPIQWSVILGDEESGVTIMQMDEGIDTGDILLVEKYRLEEKETGGSLFEKLAAFGGRMILEVLKSAEEGTLCPVKQNESEHTYAKMLSKETGRIDFSKPAVEIERLIRGLNPWPSAYCFLDGKMMKIWEADVACPFNEENSALENGTVAAVGKSDFTVKTGEGFLKVLSVQLEGKKRMDTAAFLRGYPLERGMVLKSSPDSKNLVRTGRG